MGGTHQLIKKALAELRNLLEFDGPNMLLIVCIRSLMLIYFINRTATTVSLAVLRGGELSWENVCP